jgi:hypothetical protein
MASVGSPYSSRGQRGGATNPAPLMRLAKMQAATSRGGRESLGTSSESSAAKAQPATFMAFLSEAGLGWERGVGKRIGWHESDVHLP